MVDLLICGLEFDLSNDKDVEHTWKCNSSEDECEDTNDVTVMGYAISDLLMVIYY